MAIFSVIQSLASIVKKPQIATWPRPSKNETSLHMQYYFLQIFGVRCKDLATSIQSLVDVACVTVFNPFVSFLCVIFVLK